MVEVLTAAAALLLGASGIAKLRQPGDAAAMLRRLFVPTRHRHRLGLLVRAVGLGEVAVGLAVFVTGSRVAGALLAAAYLAFTVVAVVLIRMGGTRASCGCFGRASSPVGPAHLVLNVVALGAGLAAAIRPPGPGVIGGSGAAGVTAWTQAVVLAALAYLCVTSLPALLAARREVAASTPRES